MTADVTSDRFERALDPIRSAIDDRILAGAVTLVWQRGQLQHLGAVGSRDVDAGKPMTTDTIFRVASMTKPIVSAAALGMADEGLLGLDDPITKWLPEFADMRVLDDPAGPLDATSPAVRDITVNDLLTHRAGISYDFNSTGPLANAYHPLHTSAIEDPDRWLETLASLPLVYQPGDRFHYSHCTDLLGLLLARISDQPLNELLRQRILDPLGMHDTDFWVRPEKVDRVTRLYNFREDRTIVADVEGYLTRVPTAAPALCRGGGGLVSTAADYLTFARALLGGGEVDGVRIMSPDAARLMRTNQLTERQRQLEAFGLPFWTGRGLGLGVSLVLDSERAALFGPGGNGTFGWPGAFGTWWHADPQAEAVLMFLPQWRMPPESETVSSDPADEPELFRLKVLHILFAQGVYAAL